MSVVKMTFIIFALVITSCSTVKYSTYIPKERKTEDGFGKIFIAKKTFQKVTSHTKIYVNEVNEKKRIGKVSKFDPLVIELPPGEYVIFAKESKANSIKVNIRKGEEVFLELVYVDGVYFPDPSLKLVERSDLISSFE
ncbi:MAG: hypothetical protein CME70_13320 [Halobacteriovorax sp.]|nr:hypothetical protein [Halobacteriovorax sp.]|tara:strand:- start:63387 stop:63800 length:414 start_codon:yes stop_codon:yes gene_type:complete